MSRFDFQSPGAAFSDAITELLAQRKAEERQRMLDSLTMNADTRAQEAAQRDSEQLQLQKREADVRMAGEQQRQGLERIGTFTQFLDQGDPMPKGMKPEDANLARQYNIFHEQPADPADAFVGPEPEGVKRPEPPPPQLVYTGDPKQREHTRQQKASSDVITRLMSDPSTEKRGVFAQDMADLNDHVLPADTMAKLLQPNTELFVFHQTTGKLTTMDGKPVNANELPPNAQIIEQGFQPAAYMPNFSVIGKTPDGFPILMNHKTGMSHVDKSNGPMTTPDENPLGAGQHLIDVHNESLMMLRPDQQGRVDPVKMGIARQTGLNVIQGVRATANVKAIARAFLISPDKAAEMARTSPLTADEKNDLANLVGVLGTPDIYRLNPPQVYRK